MQPNRDDVATSAYYLWQSEGHQHGRDIEHWLEAERLLRVPRFDVVLTDPGERKIELVRQLRAATGLDLTAVKTLVDDTPKPIQESVTEADAEELVTMVEAVGGTVELQPRS